jgi:hypothetical protein
LTLHDDDAGLVLDTSTEAVNSRGDRGKADKHTPQGMLSVLKKSLVTVRRCVSEDAENSNLLGGHNEHLSRMTLSSLFVHSIYQRAYVQVDAGVSYHNASLFNNCSVMPCRLCVAKSCFQGPALMIYKGPDIKAQSWYSRSHHRLHQFHHCTRQLSSSFFGSACD